MTHLGLTAALMLLPLELAPPAAAAPRDAVMAVGVADLDLRTTAGAAAAVRRIDLAARAFCGEADPRDLARAAVVAHCRSYMAARAVAVAELPALTAVYAKRADPMTLAARWLSRVSSRSSPVAKPG
jgi:UrcA family protein